MKLPAVVKRRWATFAAAGGAIVLVVAGVAAFVLWPRGGTPVSEDQALEAYRSDDLLSKFEAPALTPGTTVPPGAAPVASAEAGPAGTADGEAPAGGSAAGSPAGDPAGLPGRPAPGVYSFAAAGTESVNIGPASQTRTLADTVTATVRHTGECWSFTHDLFAEHQETTTYCPGGGGSLLMAGHTKAQKIGVVTAAAELTCSPPDLLGPAAAPPGRWSTDCTLRTTTPVFTATVTQTGTTVASGPETIRVGSTDVSAWRVQVRRSASGDMSGHWNEDIWFAAADHTIVRIERDAVLSGPARFTEGSSFALRSIQPRA